MIGKRMVMHPAWQAAHELLADPDKWFRTVALEGRGYTDAQIATAMRCMGYGDDVVVLYDGLRVAGYELPDTWVRVNENDSLDAFPGLLAMVNLPTLEDVLADPAGFAAGFDLVEQSVHPLPVELVPGFINGLLRSAG